MTGQTAFDFSARRPQTPYWNTTPLPVSELAEAIKRADKQDATEQAA